MNIKRSNISFSLLIVALFAMVLSTMHYHEESMECLDHAHEQHFAESDLHCPICTVSIQSDVPERTSAYTTIVHHSTLEFFSPIEIIKDIYPHDLSRAPPSIG